MKYNLLHKTKYTYTNEVKGYHGLACIMPRTDENQSCQSNVITILPKPDELVMRTDMWGNKLHYFSINSPHKELEIRSESFIIKKSYDQIKIKPSLTYGEALEILKTSVPIKAEVWPFLIQSPKISWSKNIEKYAAPSFQLETPLYNCIENLSSRIFHDFEFNAKFSDVNTPIEKVLKERKGVCQDFSHLAIACIRSMGIPARYISGYIETLPPPGKVKLQGSDASHAWFSANIPNVGWFEFDPTNNMVPGDQHIKTAYGRDYSDVVPVKGVMFTAGGHKLKVEVDLNRIIEN
jgi:transglutaminase-like putative cysteine protease